jgi:hypothetical protein
MRFILDKDARIGGLHTPVIMVPDNHAGNFLAYDMKAGPLVREKAGFSNIPAVALDALERGNDGLVREHVLVKDRKTGLHVFRDCEVIVEMELGLLLVSSLIETPLPTNTLGEKWTH